MKIIKLLLVIMLLFTPLAITGCTVEELTENNTESEEFISIPDGNGIYVIVHKETKVMYVVVRASQGLTMCMLVDADGKPLLYEGEID